MAWSLLGGLSRRYLATLAMPTINVRISNRMTGHQGSPPVLARWDSRSQLRLRFLLELMGAPPDLSPVYVIPNALAIAARGYEYPADGRLAIFEERYEVLA